jgi:autotransporter-associated beta strand protein
VLEQLEERAVPTVNWTLTLTDLSTVSGTTAINSIAITDNAGTTEINGVSTGVLSNNILAIDLVGDATGAANDSFNLSGVSSTDFTSLFTITVDGATQTDSLTVNNANQTWSILGNDGGAGSTVISDADVFFLFFTSVGNLNGGGGNDVFTFGDGVSVSGNINGGGGSNTLDYFAYTSVVIVNLPTNTATGVGGMISNIQNANGGDKNDIFTGNAAANLFQGNLGNDTFNTSGAGNDTLDGGAGDDLYNLSLGGGSTQISDTSGNDTVNFVTATAGVTIDMDAVGSQTVSAGNVVDFTAASIVENFIGTNFSDTISMIPLQVSRDVQGNAPGFPTLPGDTLNVDLTGTVNPQLNITGIGSGFWSFDSHANITFSGIETHSTIGTFDLVIDLNGLDVFTEIRLAPNPATLQVRNGPNFAGLGVIFSGSFASIQSITVNGSAGARAETLLVNASVNGSPVPVNDITFNAGGGADELRVVGASMAATSGSYTPDAATLGNGDVIIDTTAPTREIKFTSVDNNVQVSNFLNFTFTTPNSNDVLNVAAGNGLGAFDAPLVNLASTVTGSSGGVTLRGMNIFDVTNITVAMNTNDGGSPDDTISFTNGTAVVARNDQTFTVNGGAGNDTMSLTSTNYSLPLGGLFTFDGGAGAGDLIQTAADVNFTLSEVAAVGTLSSSGGGSIRLLNLSDELADLTGGASVNSFTITNWIGIATLNGLAGADLVNLTMTGGEVRLNDSVEGFFTLAADVLGNASAETALITSTLGNPNELNLGGNRIFNVANGAAAPDMIVNVALVGAGNLVKNGVGSLRFAGTEANTYAGDTTVNAGTLLLFKSAAGTTAVPGNLFIGDNDGTVNNDVVLLEQSEQIANTSTVTVSSSGLFSLGATFNETIGPLVMFSGTTSGANVAIGATGTLTLGGNVSLNVFGTGAQGAVIGSAPGQLSLGGVTRNFAVADGTATNDLQVDAVIVNGAATAGLNKDGTGRLTLTANDTYTGDTQVRNGILRVNGTLYTGGAGQVFLNTNPGVILEGVGTVRGRVEVQATAPNAIVRQITITNIQAGQAGLSVLAGATNVIIGGNAAGNFVTVVGSATTTGVRVQGSASLLGGGSAANRNVITGHNVGVDVNGGTALLEWNDLSNNMAGVASTAAGLVARNGAIVDAGQNSTTFYTHFTGLAGGTFTGGRSSGNNLFAGYPNAAVPTNEFQPTVPKAIRNQNTGGAYSSPGPQFGTLDLTAQNNDFGTATTNFRIEQTIYHDVDASTLGFVAYSNVSATPVDLLDFRYYAESPTAAFGPCDTEDMTTAGGALDLSNTGRQLSVIRGIQVRLSGFAFFVQDQTNIPGGPFAPGARALRLFKNNGPVLTGANDTGNVDVRLGSATYDQFTGQYTVQFVFANSVGNVPIEFGGSITDGNYQLSLVSSLVDSGGPGGPDLSGGDRIRTFHRYFGDSNGDRNVNAAELTAIQAALNARRGQVKYRACFNIDNDIDVDGTDYYHFNRRYRTRLNSDGTTPTI